MSESEDAWDQLAADYRRGIPISPEARRRLLERIAATPPPRRRVGILALTWAVFQPSISPFAAVTAVAVAFLLGAFLTGVALRPERDRALSAAHTDTAGGSRVPVQFVFIAPGARSVTVAGDFNRWDARNLRMVRVSPDGLWSLTVALHRGSHNYSFVVDGNQWVPDPSAPLAPDDGFGLRSSVVVVGNSKVIL